LIRVPFRPIYKIVDELVDRRMLVRIGENAVWLGPRLMRYGLTYRAHMSAFNEASAKWRRWASASAKPSRSVPATKA
jgi:DNA-binding IclR family transcriptional regulator